MNKINDGGPVFPDPGRAQSAKQREVLTNTGVSLRDAFAMAAMQGFLANPGGPIQANDRCGWGLVNCTYAQVADEAYAMADAMLAARGEA